VLGAADLATVIPRAVNRRELAENLGTLAVPDLSQAERRRVEELQAGWSERPPARTALPA